jgi:hypothetical protein
VAASSILSLVAAAPAPAEPAVGIIEGNLVATFDTAAPGTYTAIRPVTGLQSNERVAGIAFRHNPLGVEVEPAKRLYALGIQDGAPSDTVRLYTVDPGTGAATLIGGSATVDSGTNYGFAYNPQSDRYRVVHDLEENARFNPNSGIRSDSVDNNLSPAGDQIVAVSHDRIDTDPATATTLYGLSQADATLVRIGGPDGSPSPNLGAVTIVGPTGTPFAAGTGESLNLDISQSGTAYATAVSAGTGAPGLYTVNLATGAFTLLGQTPTTLRAFAVVPGATVQFAQQGYSQPEDGGPATIAVTRAGSTASTVSVPYSTTDGAAGSVTFAVGETSKTFTVPVGNDSTDGADRNVGLSLGTPTLPASLGAPANATLTVVDDDPPPTPPTPPDVTAPTTTLASIKSSMTLAAFKKGIKVTATPNEAAALDFMLEGTATTVRLRLAAFELALATRALPLAAGPRTVTLKPKSKLVGRPRKAFKVRIRVTATDAAGNRKAVVKTVKVTLPKPKKSGR